MHIIRHTHIKFTRIWWRYVTRVREAHRTCISIEKNDLQYKLERNFLALKKSRVFSLFPSLWKEQNSYSGEQPQLCVTYAYSPSNAALLSQRVYPRLFPILCFKYEIIQSNQYVVFQYQQSLSQWFSLSIKLISRSQQNVLWNISECY